MNAEKRIDLLIEEYIMLQNFYEDIDSKGLTIKNWAITVAVATIGTGLLYRKEVLFIGLFAAIVFWYLEGYWRGLSHFFSTRIQEIEQAFQKGKWNEEVPLQVYSTWAKEYKKSKDQTLRYMLKTSSLWPHIGIIALTILIYFLS